MTLFKAGVLNLIFWGQIPKARSLLMSYDGNISKSWLLIYLADTKQHDHHIHVLILDKYNCNIT